MRLRKVEELERINYVSEHHRMSCIANMIEFYARVLKFYRKNKAGFTAFYLIVK